MRCDTEKLAKSVARQINYARSMYEERKQAVSEEDESEIDD